ncbi:MAG: hypothetical protein PUP91_31020 [Rhizonema sp. PD37]|nr:hypothetical protein [Rhizonema sp. PD37]
MYDKEAIASLYVPRFHQSRIVENAKLVGQKIRALQSICHTPKCFYD